MKHILYFLLLFSFGYAQPTLSPSVIGSAGKESTNSNYRLAWNIGETVVTTISNTTNTLNQGFEQPEYLYNVGITPKGEKVTYSLYPNPAADFIRLQIEKMPSEILAATLFNATGQAIYTQKVNDLHTEISLLAFPAGVYQLQLSNSSLFSSSITFIKK